MSELEVDVSNKTTKNMANQANIAKARARRFAMQSIYQHLLTGDSFSDIAKQVTERESGKDYDSFFYSDIIEGIAEFSENFNMQLTPLVNRPIEQLDFVEHAILLVACYELNDGVTPPKVAINEAIILAKKFGGNDGHKFINGVVDSLYQSIKRNSTP